MRSMKKWLAILAVAVLALGLVLPAALVATVTGAVALALRRLPATTPGTTGWTE